MKHLCTLGLALVCGLGLNFPAPASVIVNGDFEDWPGATPSGWTLIQGSNPAKQTGPNAISGATSALFSASGRLGQTFSPLSNAPSRFELDFAAEDLSGETNPGTLRSLNLGLFYNASYTSGPRVHLLVNGQGDVQVHSGSWFTPAGLAGAVSLDADVTTSPVVNHLAVTSFGQLPLPLYQIQVTDADNNVHRSALLRRYEPNEPSAPGTGDAWQAVQFRSDLSVGDYLVDNVGLTEMPWIPPISVVAQHFGNTNPTAEGWARVDSGGGSSVSGISDDAETGIAAWRINSSNTTRTFYRQDLTAAEATAAMDRGWQLEAVLRVTDSSNAPNNTRYVSFVTPGDSATGREFALNFGSDANGNALIQFAETAETYNLGAGGYHLFSMVYDPATELASLFIDGNATPALSGYSGFAKNAVFGTDTFVRFGSVNTSNLGAANYHFVQFSIIPEPGALVLLAMAVGALLSVRPRRR